MRAKAQRGDRDATGFERVETIEYDVTLDDRELRGLPRPRAGGRPERAARFAELEADLRSRFTPGDYTVPMRADLLRSAGQNGRRPALRLTASSPTA